MDPTKRTFAVYGNCQAAAIGARLLAQPEFAARWQQLPMASCFDVPPADHAEWLARHQGSLDLLITQNLQDGWRRKNPIFDIAAVSGALRPGGRVLRYTDQYWRGVNPLLVYPRSFARLPHCDYLDLIALTTQALGLASPALCRALWEDPALLLPHELETIHQLSEFELARREAGLDLTVAPAFSALCRQQPAFHTFNHPSHLALDILAAQICQRLDVPASAPAQTPGERLGAIRFPLPAAVKARYTQPLAHGLHVKGVCLRGRVDLPLEDYFQTELAALATVDMPTLRRELDLHRAEPISGIVVQAVERALAQRLGQSVGGLEALGRLGGKAAVSEFILTKANPASVGFMTDILATLRAHLLPRHAGQKFTVLDLGARTGAGSQLMAYVGQAGSYAKLKFSVTCADIDPTYAAYSRAQNPLVEYLNADAFKAGRQWDIVICSHVVEHVPQPLAFVEQLRRIAKRHVVLAFPYAEDPQQLIPGHVNSLNHDFIRALRPSRTEVFEGLYWGQSLCCVLVLDITP